jgi:hypothetical protein
MAWEATVGYISSHHSPDATLKLQVTSLAADLRWSASLSWGGQFEEARDRTQLVEALRDLWHEVELSHEIFTAPEDAVKRPVNYADDAWFDDRTTETLDRLVQVTQTVFEDDWQIIIIYQPVESPDKRLQARLLAENNIVHVGGRGPSLREACANLYHNAAREYASRRK